MVAMALTAVAQTFVETNADGKELKYTVADATAQTVNLVANSYSGHIAVPQQVTHEGVTYTVVGIGTSFKNSANLTYLEVPSTVTKFEYQSFQQARRIDTLVSHSTTPITVAYGTGNPSALFVARTSTEPLRVEVPCGSLRIWRNGWWGVMPGLRSDCAVHLAVVPSEDSIVRVDSVIVNGRAHYSNGWYEIGDTAHVAAERFVWRNEYGGIMQRYAQFFGWSNGIMDMQFDHVVTGSDTIEAYCSEVMHNTVYANNVYAGFVSTYGNIGYDGSISQYQVEYAATGGNSQRGSTLYQTNLWIGNGTKLAAGRFWNNGCDYFPGPLRLADAQTDWATARQYNKVWRVNRGMIDYHIEHCGDAGYTPLEDIATWPGNGPEGYAQQLAPYYDADNDGIYNPMAGDYPIIRGDECTFSIFNDAFMPHTESGGQPLGIEVHCMTYAFDEPDSAMGYTVFTHYDIYNRASESYEGVYVGAFTDFDIGVASDDYIGCDVQRNMFYGYNGQAVDLSGVGSFVGVPPAQSCTFLGGAQASNGARLGMTNFTYYLNSVSGRNAEPSNVKDYYNYMRSLWRDSTHVTFGGDGLSGTINCTHMFPWDSDPEHVSTGGIDPGFMWSEVMEGNPPSDRRGVGASGPFTFTAGSVQQIDLAYTTAWGSDFVNSVSALGFATDNVRRQWIRDTTDTGRPFTYRPYSAPHDIGISGVVNDAAIRLYPNPTDGKLRVEVPNVQRIEVYDLYGRLTTAVQDTNNIDLTTLPSGNYVVRVTYAQGVAVRHVVKR